MFSNFFLLRTGWSWLWTGRGPAAPGRSSGWTPAGSRSSPPTSVGDPWHFGPYSRIRIYGSVPLAPDPTPDPTPFFNDFKDVKKKFFFKFFSYNVPTGTSSSVLKMLFLLKFCVKILFCQALFQSAQDIYEKREGSGSGRLKNMVPNPYPRLLIFP